MLGGLDGNTEVVVVPCCQFALQATNFHYRLPLPKPALCAKNLLKNTDLKSWQVDEMLPLMPWEPPILLCIDDSQPCSALLSSAAPSTAAWRLPPPVPAHSDKHVGKDCRDVAKIKQHVSLLAVAVRRLPASLQAHPGAVAVPNLQALLGL